MKPRIIVDTREKNPLDFSKSRTFDLEMKKLHIGDYGLEIDNILQPIIVERKSALDLFSTLTHGHARFIKELQRNSTDTKLIILVEASYFDIINKTFPGYYRTKMQGFVLIKIIHTIELKYDVQFIFVNDRIEAQTYITNLFKAQINLKTKNLS